MKVGLPVISGLVLVFAQSSAFASGNPASVLCEKFGGRSEIAISADGEIGICNLNNGLIEEWTLYREDTDDNTIAVQRLLNPLPAEISAAEDKAYLYCGDQQGENISVKDKDGSEYGLCKFSDDSMIEE